MRRSGPARPFVGTEWVLSAVVRVRNKVIERHAMFAGAGSAALACWSPARPTPLLLCSVLLLAAAGFVVAWAGASAPWWVLGVVTAGAYLVADDAMVSAAAALAFVGACWIGIRRDDLAVHRALVAAVAVNCLLRSGRVWCFGGSAAVGFVLCCSLVAFAIARRPRAVRRIAGRALLVAVALAAVAIAGAGLAAQSSKSALRNGDHLAQKGLSALRAGNFSEAADLLDSASRQFAQARDALDQPWVAPAQLIPVVAQHAAAARELSSAAAHACERIALTITGIDLDSLRVVDGGLDLDTVVALQQPFDELAATMQSLRTAVDDARSPWLVSPVADLIEGLRSDLQKYDDSLQTTRSAVHLLPAILGADAPRTYLVLLTSPAEARGLGGFPGNFAELHAADGRLTLSRFGRWSDLERVIDPATFHVDGPAGFVDRYGQFGYELSANGVLKGSPWRNLTMPPDFPTVAQVAAEMYPQSGGMAVDGVAIADVYVLQALLRFTGPIRVDGWPEPINQRNAAQVLLRDQYTITDLSDRVDFISDVARTAIDRVLSGALPGPVQLTRVLGPLASQGRLLFWSNRPDEQTMLEGAHLLGRFPSLAGTDQYAIALTNLGGNKNDTFLDRAATYERSVRQGVTSATLHVTLTNNAPTSGLPLYIIGNNLHLPPGTNQARLCVYSAMNLDSWELTDADREQPWERIPEFGVTAFCRSVSIPPGGAIDVTMHFSGQVTPTDGNGAAWVQPLTSEFVLAGTRSQG